MSEYGLDAKLHLHQGDSLEIGHVKLNHKKSGCTVDHYANDANKDLKCGHQTVDHNRPGTKMLLDGILVPGPDNPGLYGRTYGMKCIVMFRGLFQPTIFITVKLRNFRGQ